MNLTVAACFLIHTRRLQIMLVDNLLKIFTSSKNQ